MHLESKATENEKRTDMAAQEHDISQYLGMKEGTISSRKD